MTLLGATVVACSTSKEKEQLKYPETKKGEVVDTYFGEEVADPYRWLEDDLSEETAAWVKAQNEVTFGYLEQIPYRNEIKERLLKLADYERISAPRKKGDYTYFYKNDGLQNQSVMYRSDKDGKEEIFLDPNTFSEDATTSLSGVDFTKDGSLAAYAISEAGSDWRKVILIDAVSKEQIEDTLIDIKFSGVSWLGNEGFFYSSYEKPEGSVLSAKTDQHKVFYHKLGTKQSEDKVVFGEKEKYRYVGAYVTEDEQYLVLSCANSTSGNHLYVAPINDLNSLITLDDNIDETTSVLDNDGQQFYLFTNHNAPNNKIVTVELSNASKDAWKDLIPETKEVLSPTTGGGYIFAQYMKDVNSLVKQYNYDGTLVRDIDLPGLGTASGFGGEREDETLYFSFSNYITPSTIYSFDPKSGEDEVYKVPEIDFDASLYDYKQVFYPSKDGTKVPMTVVFKKGIEMNGDNPTILYGYGGFDISLTPNFSIAIADWIEMGGVYAVANLRGGGEYGREWHDAGTQMKKQNVFDDFIAAGEYLIQEKYTSSKKLAIMGGSNGGLLVGACMTQRPDLFAVALPAVGVMDMLRYHTFTAGAGWAYDYGTSEDSKEMFEYLKGYSPVHNVKKGVEYPATMVTTGDHDDRVVPAHSFKFAAELQDKQTGTNPVLIRIEVNAGHGAGKPLDMIYQEVADKFAFALYNMDVEEIK